MRHFQEPRSLRLPLRQRTLTLLLGCLVLIPPVRAAADGCFVWRNREIDILEPAQKALIVHDQGTEDLVLSVSYSGAPEEFGWIVPLPAVPEMFAEDSLLFTVLSQATQRRQFERSARGVRLHAHLGTDGIAERRVGIYDTKIVQSDSGRELTGWLQAHGFSLAPGAERVLARYVDDGWVFATLRIAPDAIEPGVSARLHSGTIPPIRFRFASPEPVFPLEISSLMPGGSEVLLYVLSRELLVPKTPQPGRWECQINSRCGRQYWIDRYEYESRTDKFLPGAEAPFYLTKHRARLQPEEMQDVRFGPYDPARGLRSESDAERLEAIAYCGWIRPPGAASELLQRFRAGPTLAESLSILWAFGEVGGPEGERLLLRQVEARNPEIRIEAIEALVRLRSSAALPLLARGLEVNVEQGDHWASAQWKAVRRACFDGLVAQQDPTCLDDLHRVAEAHHGVESWDLLGTRRDPMSILRDAFGGDEDDTGFLAVAALAACGDSAARQAILRAVIAGGRQATSPAVIALRRGGRGSYNGYPNELWPVLAARSPLSALRDWAALRRAYPLFAVAPEFRTGLLEEAAAAPGMPRTGVIILLASSDTLRLASVERLLELWDESIREPRRWISAELEDPLGATAPPIVLYNYDACAIVHALGRHHRLKELERLWAERPKDDPVLEGELACVMAETGASSFRPFVLDYVERVWGEAARSEAFAQAVAEIFRDPRRSGGLAYHFGRAGLDLGYRVPRILAYLFPYPADLEFERGLLLKRDLPPYLRLTFIGSANYFEESRRELIPLARDELARLRKDLSKGDGLAIQVADSMQVRLERTERLLDEIALGRR